MIIIRESKGIKEESEGERNNYIWNNLLCCVIIGKNKNEKEGKRKRVVYLLATDSIIPVQTCVWPSAVWR